MADKTSERLKKARQAAKKQAKSTSWRDAKHTLIPPARTGYQEEGLMMLPMGKYKMPDGSRQVSLGLPQPILNAYRSMRYGLGAEQDPNAPKGYVSQGQIEKGALGLSSLAAAGGVAAKGIKGALNSRAAARQRIAGQAEVGRSMPGEGNKIITAKNLRKPEGKSGQVKVLTPRNNKRLNDNNSQRTLTEQDAVIPGNRYKMESVQRTLERYPDKESANYSILVAEYKDLANQFRETGNFKLLDRMNALKSQMNKMDRK